MNKEFSIMCVEATIIHYLIGHVDIRLVTGAGEPRASKVGMLQAC